ncbi:MAG TPA: response regulator, partial [Gammaproteobacteria bacterium]|nr:response regulator [Gammaproteobacteria bacterium]
YDVVFMDIGLPYMDGLEVTQRIRKLSDYQRTPIIATTAHAFESDIQRCRDASMNDVLVKPLAISNIKTALTTWVANKKS